MGRLTPPPRPDAIRVGNTTMAKQTQSEMLHANSNRGMRDALIDAGLQTVLAGKPVAPQAVAQAVLDAINKRCQTDLTIGTVARGLVYTTGIRAIDPSVPSNMQTRTPIALPGGKLSATSGFVPRRFTRPSTQAASQQAASAYNGKPKADKPKADKPKAARVRKPKAEPKADTQSAS